VLVEVDGGVAPGNVREFAAADVFVAGSAVFSGDYRERIAALRAGHAASG
jgi:pentose-5-phosphate-3-epimerase